MFFGELDIYWIYSYGVYNNLLEGLVYLMRMVFNGEFWYICNLILDEVYIEKYLMGMCGGGGFKNLYWFFWMVEVLDNENMYFLVCCYMYWLVEELYYISEDFYEFNSFIVDFWYVEVFFELWEEFDCWMKV